MLHGPRVTLRALTTEDVPRIVAFSNDVEFELAGGGAPPRPTSIATVSERFEERQRDRELVAFGIEADSKLIGDCALFKRNRTAATAELGIGIGDHDYWGRGYGREAIGLLLDYGFRLENIRRIWLETHSENIRAQRCYLACGFVEEGRQREHQWYDGRYVDVVQMGLLRSEWKPVVDDDV
jgi:RimJ/RimL family protein N-acetyltransferase